MWFPDVPFNELPPPPRDELETKTVLKATTAARAALAALDQAIHRIPNPAVLLSAVSLLEAQASSEVENIVTTTDDLFRFASSVEEHASPETKETLRYREALFKGLHSIKSRPLSTTTAIAVCSTINNHQTGIRRLPGTYIGKPSTGIARYTPPEGHEVIANKLAAWEQYLHHDDDLDPLVVMCAAHYQFEAIHPFPDGNGRTGRILNVLLLIERDLLRQPILYLSKYIIQHKDEYYDRLLAVTRDNAWEEWITYMLRAVEMTARSTLGLIDHIQDLQSSMREELRATLGNTDADLLDLLFERPYCRVADVIERCSVSRPTATKWLRALTDENHLVSQRVGRENLYINHRFLASLSKHHDV
ncbi:Fic family protein [Glutamicibacter endophyticus]|uniref:Fic family protein n=1 Tax=Glutamicibacter endophyticus TaxID=1522174 RepID=UPI003AF01404